jgi:hypothetical protein
MTSNNTRPMTYNTSLTAKKASTSIKMSCIKAKVTFLMRHLVKVKTVKALKRLHLTSDLNLLLRLSSHNTEIRSQISLLREIRDNLLKLSELRTDVLNLKHRGSIFLNKVV